MLNEQEKKGPGRPSQVRTTCAHCHGTGKDPNYKIPGTTKPFNKKCTVCGGKGYLVKTGTVTEQAPANAMGGAAYTSTAPVQLYDPILVKKMLKRRKVSKN